MHIYLNMRHSLIFEHYWCVINHLSEKCKNCLVNTMTECHNCKASSTLPQDRGVSLSSLNREFIKFICMDHFFSEFVTIFHIMGVSSRFTACILVTYKSMDSCLSSFKLVWVAQCWPPSAVYTVSKD